MAFHTRPRPVLDRRAFLRNLALGASAIAVGPTLAACGGSGGVAASSGPAVPLPTYAPAGRITPDLLGNADGLQDGFLRGISDRVPVVQGTPGSGGPFRAMVATYLPPPPPVSDNAWWQAVNQRVGADIQMDIVPAGDYAAKFGSVVAGNALPDLVQVPLYLSLPRLPDLFRNRFADLSDHLSGDNVLKYPNLAGIPTYAWRNGRIDGRIYGVPVARPVFGGPMLVRTDITDGLGVDAAPTSADAFVELCRQVTDPRAGRWALTAPSTYSIDWFSQLFGAPKFWRLDNGALTRDYETSEYLEAVEFVRGLVAAGYFHPDSGSATPTQVKQYVSGGQAVMSVEALVAWLQYYETYSAAVPGLQVGALTPFAHDGGTATYHLDTGAFGVNGLAQAEPERIEELLRILDFFAAPFGSQEELLVKYGVPDVDHTVATDGRVALTDLGRTERSVNFDYLATGAPVIVSGQFPDIVRAQYEWEQRVLPLGVGDPTLGLYSDTASRVNSQIDRAMRDAIYGIIAGRAPVSDFQTALTAWRNGGGDRMREEFQVALAATEG